MSYKKILIFSLINVFLFGCSTKIEEKTTPQKKSKELDSIALWLEKGRNKKNNEDERFHYLKKAQTTIKNINDDSLRARQLSKLSLAYLKLEKNETFRKVNHETIQLAKKIGDSVTQAESYWDLAGFYKNIVMAPDSSYFYYSEAQKLYRGLGNQKLAGNMLYNMAVVQADTRDYTGSEINTIKALEILKPLGDNLRIYRCYNMLGINSKYLKAYDRGIEFYNKALEYAIKLENSEEQKIGLLNNIGSLYLGKNNYTKAAEYFDKVVSNNNYRKKKPDTYSKSLNQLGYCKLKLGQHDNLPWLFLEAERILDSVQELHGLSGTLKNLGEFYFTVENDTSKSIAYGKKAFNLARVSKNNEGLLDGLEFLTRVDTKNAAKHAEAYIQLNDSLVDAERAARDKFARIRFETDEFIAENETLEKQKQLWTGIAIGLLLLAGALFIIIDQRVKNQRLKFQQEQQASNQEIFNLMLSQKQKVQEGKQMEQKRISEELHDGVLGKMLGARMVLTGLNKRSGDEVIQERAHAIATLKDIEGEVRSISHELSHNAYQKIHNFINSIEDLLNGIQKSSGINYDFSYDHDIEWDELSGDIKINTYRMIQECMQNSRKHAECTEVFVNFDIYDSNFVIAMGDNGKGFKQDKERKGIGMRNLQSRIKKLDGQLDIESTLGKGTKITLTVPIPEKEESEEENQPIAEHSEINQPQT